MMSFPRVRTGDFHVVAVALVTVCVVTPTAVHAQDPPAGEFSPAFLGMYRKVMEIDEPIRRFAIRYGVDVDLARAVCMYESGGNAGLASHAGAQGYFQLMPGTFRELQVETNIEAGVKYISQMLRQFGREDRAVAAYNGGPARISRGGALPLETLQYVVGVGHYRSVLKQYDEVIRRQAARLQLVSIAPGDTWSSMSARLGLSEWELRLHNPFLAGRPLRVGSQLVHPAESRRDLLVPIEGGAEYRVRLGDNYIKLAITLGLDIEAFRAENGLWQIQSVQPGTVLRIPFALDRANVVRTALTEPSRASMPSARAARKPVHMVQRGDTLSAIARRYSTTVLALRRSNNLPGTGIRVGQLLTIEVAAGRGVD